jgi:hypothetical protein
METSNIFQKGCTAYTSLERDLFICFLYISPSNSSFVQKRDLDKQIFSKLEADIAKYSLRGDIMLMGDLNAHINCDEHDFIIKKIYIQLKPHYLRHRFIY